MAQAPDGKPIVYEQISVKLESAFAEHLRGIAFAQHRSLSALIAMFLYERCGYVRGQGMMDGGMQDE